MLLYETVKKSKDNIAAQNGKTVAVDNVAFFIGNFGTQRCHYVQSDSWFLYMYMSITYTNLGFVEGSLLN